MNIIFVLCVISFTLSIDYSLSLISAEAYWATTGGKHILSGLVFGIYDITTCIIVPFLSLYLGYNGSYKKMFIVGLIINMLGNVVYALAYLANSWVMIITGRAVAGIGATTVPMIMVYIIENISQIDQKKAVTYTKYIVAVTRIIGPLLGSIFTVTETGNHAGIVYKLFNMYTLVGWIPIVFDIVTITLVVFFFSEKKTDTEVKQLLINNETNTNYRLLLSLVWPILTIGLFSTIIYWFFLGNSFVIGTHFFKVINNTHQLWHIYITGFAGIILAFIIFMMIPNLMSNIIGLIVSFTILIIGLSILLIPYNPMFYLGVGVSTFGYALMIPSINIINNNIAKKNQELLGNKMAFIVMLLTIVQSIARTVGPSIFIVFGENDTTTCNFTDPDNYQIIGCVLKNYYLVCGILICGTTLTMIISVIFLYRLRKHFE